MAQYDINLRDYWRIIRRRKWIIIFTTLVLALFSLVFAKLNEPPPIYSATSSVRIERNTTLQGLLVESFTFNPADDLATQAVVIRSFPVMEQVAQEMGAVEKNLSSVAIRKDSRLVARINQLQSQVATSQKGVTNIIDITVTSGDPDAAYRMANTVAEVYGRYDTYARNRQVIEQRRFIEGQVGQTEGRLRTSENRIKTFKEENRFLTLDAEASNTLRRVAELERLHQEVSEQLREARAQLREMDAQGGIRSLSLTRGGPLALLNQQLLEAQMQRSALLQDFTPQHPQVEDLGKRAENLVAQMRSLLKSEEESLARREASLKRELDGLRDVNQALPDKGLQLARLERDVRVNTEVFTLLRSKLEEARIRESGQAQAVSIVKPAFRPAYRDNPPHLVANALVGAVLGLMVGLVFAFVLETMDTSIGAIEDVESYLGVPVLGIVPEVDAEELERTFAESYPDRTSRFSAEVYSRLICHFIPRSPIAEAYRSLRTQMEFMSLEKSGKHFVVTSSSPGEGKTSTSINLALTFAQTGKRTLLIEADLRKPAIYRIFGIEREPGLTDVLLGNHGWRETVRTVTDIMLGKFEMEDILLTPGLDNLNILTCGSIPPNPSELLNSTRMSEFLEEVGGEFDVVILDTPPILPVTDAAVLGSRVDGVVVVYRVGQVARGALKRAKLQMDNVKAKVWGVVLNAMRAEVSPDLDTFKYYAHYYYGGYAETPEGGAAPQRWYQRIWSGWRGRAGPKGAAEAAAPKRERAEAGRAGALLRGILLALALLSFLAGLLWQAGVDLPFLGSLARVQERVGLPSPELLPSRAPEAIAPRAAPPAPAAAPPAQSRSTDPERGDGRVPAAGAPLSHPSKPGELPPPAPAAARGEEVSPEGGRPFSILWGRAATQAAARREVVRLARGGHLALFVPDGTAARRRSTAPEGPFLIYVGSFGDAEEARRYGEGRLDDGGGRSVVRLPYALRVEGIRTQSDLDLARVLLKARGFSPYEVRDGKGGGFPQALLIGAFPSPAAAESLAEALRREGMEPSVVLR